MACVRACVRACLPPLGYPSDIRRNSLEALVWEKEAEVDRFRDRWPMSMLVSRSRLFNLEEENKPRDVLAALQNGKGASGVSILAEARGLFAGAE